MNKTKIPKIKEKTLELVYTFINDKTIQKQIFLESIGKEFLEYVLSDPLISIYQWKYESNGIHSLLEGYFLKNFLFKLIIFRNINKIDEVKESTIFNEYFEEQFSILENKILLSEFFDYQIYIPTFEIYLPEGVEEIVFDDKHKIINIPNEIEPYTIKDFKKPSSQWDQDSSKKKANCSFEISISIKKRVVSDDPYNESFTPTAPMDSRSSYNIFGEKVKSIYDFFFIYKKDFYYPGIFTFGDKYYIKLPPFSLEDEIFNNYIFSIFPPPRTQMRLDRPNIGNNIEEWKSFWKDKYNTFYQKYNPESAVFENNGIFRYVLDILRTVNNVPYPEVNNFLLVSTLEGLLFLEKIKKKIKKQLNLNCLDKKTTVAKTFVEVCDDQHKYWQEIFLLKYSSKTPLISFKTKDDLEQLIISCFKHRNNIAHPEKKNPVPLKPSYLNPPEWNEKDKFIIEGIINRHFTLFLSFLIRTWLDKGFSTRKDWYTYLLSLF
ncbi:MAG: hypothetical protein KGD63_07170 [Candidatus Lokiarchaeota archaeon]|nr:hypothetical protein [Candidatus Lokiarchaeota archaeon]